MNAAQAEALFARALELHQRGEVGPARQAYAQCLSLQPEHAQALHLLGVTFAQAGDAARGAALMERALRLEPGDAAAWSNRGNALEDLRRHADALACYERAWALGAAIDYLPGHRLRSRLQVARWDGWDAAVDDAAARVRQGSRAAMPFDLLSIVDDPALHRRCAEIYAQDRCPADGTLGPLPPPAARAPGRRIHVGYFSSDFYEHATLHLMLEMLERHDRARFELTAFSFGTYRDDAWRQRLARSVDRVVDVHARSDREAAALARQLGVDIAVDLKGHTNSARAGIFGWRAAPLQAAFLGYPGSFGSPLMDYAIADRTVVPDSGLAHWTERVVRLPGCYQPNMARREVAPLPSRAAAGLPAGAFVYASFNASYKITPAVWAGWMRILRRVPGSVLWLLAAPGPAREALAAHAAGAGVAPSRLVWADAVPTAEHLARLPLADLMLDTHPYGAHTTASDALRMGLPVLTRAGDSFASRVAASLLHTIGLPELVTTEPQTYEDLAVVLARHPPLLASLRARIAPGVAASGLHDATAFARRLEAAYTAVFERWRAGQPPAHLDVFDGPDGPTVLPQG